ncbi:probable RNA-dependent RNA polymerase 1 [Mercurialis annua]|uniref:probable RNA-dependent RNA polymerase 1 n=1 Tax=Mercurialis annua TaxID=3986 RepID=UPI00215FFD68|nr:probable RNA-dependent RNA polymerase 1 [Mercurialis annua]
MDRTVHMIGFPSNTTAKNLKEFLENKVGKDNVYAIRIRDTRAASTTKQAFVMFSNAKIAEQTINMSRFGLRYGDSNMRVQPAKRDFVPNSTALLCRMDNVTLHFGCQLSKERFCVLWKKADVVMKFSFGFGKMLFFLSHDERDYKLDLPFDNIKQIYQFQSEKVLLIQLYGAPRIYEKVVQTASNVFESPFFNYIMDDYDDQWVRTTDFTPLCLIGHSTALYLEFPASLQLPKFEENSVLSKEVEEKIELEHGEAFSDNEDLVPIVTPPSGECIPFQIVYQVNSLMHNGCLVRVDANFFKHINSFELSFEFLQQTFEKLFYKKECCYNPLSWISEQHSKYQPNKDAQMSLHLSPDTGFVYVRRIYISPCKVYFCGPELNVSNRVLRHFSAKADHFVRVSFVDEELDRLYSTVLASRISSERTAIYNRILSVLRNGISIGTSRFEFLAFSSSQLRESSCWMFDSKYDVKAADVRKWIGNFQGIRNVAKYAARLGQSFGSSTKTLNVSRAELEIIADIEVETRGTKYLFSDGIGKISESFAKRVALKCSCHGTPSAFQIRYAGYKGVVALDPKSTKKLSLRKSMYKYECDNTGLDVLAYSKYQPCFLNRQLIILLSCLGVPDCCFEKKQNQAIEMLTDPLRVEEALDMFSGDTDVLKDILSCYKPDAEPFLCMMLQALGASKLVELRTKTRIFLPMGRLMMGCLDETRTSDYGQVFVQYSGIKSNQQHVWVGKVVIAKSPCLHPGDVRVLMAVNVPALSHMIDCVVFPQKGARPHPNECSGSDLDGDVYFVCWDPDLIPCIQIPPMDYTSEASVQLEHDVTIEEVEEYFANYIINDNLGIIANAHAVIADREPGKAMSKPCLELAKNFSIAVDYAKTGKAAEIPSNIRVKEYPDFMEKSDKPTYESKSVIGKLFRGVRDVAPHTNHIKTFTWEMANQCYDSEMEVDGFNEYIDDAFCYKKSYDYKLGNLMDCYGIKTEAEIISGNIMKMSKAFNKRRDPDAIGMAIKSLRKEARSLFNEKGSLIETEASDVYAKASAWYYVTYHPSYWNRCNEGMNRDHFLSFPWCVSDKLVQIKRNKANS